jgi:hypothetical protein
MNALQGLTPNENFFVTINHPEKIKANKIIQKNPD